MPENGPQITDIPNKAHRDTVLVNRKDIPTISGQSFLRALQEIVEARNGKGDVIFVHETDITREVKQIENSSSACLHLLDGLDSEQLNYFREKFGIEAEDLKPGGRIYEDIHFPEEDAPTVAKLLKWGLDIAPEKFSSFPVDYGYNLNRAMRPINRTMILAGQLINLPEGFLFTSGGKRAKVGDKSHSHELGQADAMRAVHQLVEIFHIQGQDWESEIKPQLNEALQDMRQRLPLHIQLDESEENRFATIHLIRYLLDRPLQPDDELAASQDRYSDLTLSSDEEPEEVRAKDLEAKTQLQVAADRGDFNSRRTKIDIGGHEIIIHERLRKDEIEEIKRVMRNLPPFFQRLRYLGRGKKLAEKIGKILEEYRYGENVADQEGGIREYRDFKKKLLAGQLNAEQIGPLSPVAYNGQERRVIVNAIKDEKDGRVYRYEYDLEPLPLESPKGDQKFRDMYLAEQHILKSVKKRMGL